MFENRIREFMESEPAVTTHQPAFVACPIPVVVGFTGGHLSFVAEIYRRAQELAEEQLRKPKPRLLPHFSLN